MIAPIIRILAGLALLTLGRKLFWLFVAVIGFGFGILLADRLFPQQDEIVRLVVSLAIGVLGGLLAVFLQKLAIFVAGFLAGGSILVNLLAILGVRAAPSSDFFLLVVFVIGGVLGAILVTLVFDWALILLSSLAGATLIVRQLFPEAPLISTTIFLVLLIVGVLIQALAMRGEKA